MSQNLISLELSAESLTKLDQAIATIEEVFAPFLSLSTEEVRGLAKMGDKSEQFCRQTALVLEQNQEILPSTFYLGEMHKDIAAFDALRQRLVRLRGVLAKGEDTGLALGSDIFTAALEGYALMKMYGKAEWLDELRQAMAVRSPGRPRKPSAAAV
ncbi:hypothetical protein ETQ85_05165 [Zoogloea oleivorans]|uniref:Uncharacterized protein n=1 Tax=Zoogloea oleivorans TaxID=1552750 RepID=A0A6C2D471_9RHOO|nr:hypothetical protein [Zoogloea oleivorans]TYC60791.1 hypothetical protein ETQ85_05165 [Zoogloea oleivorans]